jgi:hypothetical protein
MEIKKSSRLLFLIFIMLFIYWLFDSTMQYIAAIGVFLLGSAYGRFSNLTKRKVDNNDGEN